MQYKPISNAIRNLVFGSRLTIHQADHQINYQTKVILSLIVEETALVAVMAVGDSVGAEAEDADIFSQVIAAIILPVIIAADRVTLLNFCRLRLVA